jgi:hypothetical protein
VVQSLNINMGGGLVIFERLGGGLVICRKIKRCLEDPEFLFQTLVFGNHYQKQYFLKVIK